MSKFKFLYGTNGFHIIKNDMKNLLKIFSDKFNWGFYEGLNYQIRKIIESVDIGKHYICIIVKISPNFYVCKTCTVHDK